jgi:hypothetical protein
VQIFSVEWHWCRVTSGMDLTFYNYHHLQRLQIVLFRNSSVYEVVVVVTCQSVYLSVVCNSVALNDRNFVFEIVTIDFALNVNIAGLSFVQSLFQRILSKSIVCTRGMFRCGQQPLLPLFMKYRHGTRFPSFRSRQRQRQQLVFPVNTNRKRAIGCTVDAARLLSFVNRDRFM